MKIKHLRFKNLNSLAGEWSIDLTATEYVTDGIFAISGPTGAGKSTILDAICLALYGRTPRLKSISKNTNEIMSRQTGICFAEVVFETHEGSFIAFWSQKRAKEKAEGELQQAKHELSNADTNVLIASQLSTTGLAIEKKTGMDYERFVQSMMLAQGGFAAFLQASGSERAPILEQITGTDIYSKLSIHVFERQKTEKNFLDNLKAESIGISVLSDEEEEQAKNDLDSKTATKITATENAEKLNAASLWLKGIDKLNTELKGIGLEETASYKDISDFQPNREKLKSSQTAAKLDGDYASLDAVRKRQTEELSSLSSLNLKAPELIKTHEASEKESKTADTLLKDAKTAQESLQKICIKVRSEDQTILQTKGDMQNAEKEVGMLTQEKDAEAAKKAKIQEAITALKTETVNVTDYLLKNAADSGLIAELTGIQEKVNTLTEVQKTVAENKKVLETLGRSLEIKKRELKDTEGILLAKKTKHQAELERIKQVQDEHNSLLKGKPITEYQTKKDSLIQHLAELKMIADFATERSKLEDGKACPLCGSQSHPFAEGNIPPVSEAETELAKLIQLLEKSGTLTKLISEIQILERASAESMQETVNAQTLKSEQILSLDLSIKEKKDLTEKSESNLQVLISGLKKMLKAYGISEIPEDVEGVKKIMTSLEYRKNKWLEQEKRNREIESQINSKLNEISAHEVFITTKEKDIVGKSAEKEQLQTLLTGLLKKRFELFGDKDPEAEEKMSAEKVRAAENTFKQASELLRVNKQLLDENAGKITELKVTIADRQPLLSNMEEKFTTRIKELGFRDEKEFISCRLELKEREVLEGKAKILDDKKSSIETRKAEKDKQLKSELSKKLTTETIEIISVKLIDANDAVTSLLLETGALKEKLDANTKAKVRGLEIAKKIDLQKAVFERWSALSRLIGSADGKKYRNFAQGLTLEIMVSYANSQLTKLSDRYLLIRDKDEPLELNVMDNYQAGEIRSTKNLSGGESFIVSLALALGLSRMSSRNVRVDSLFLDEGFGTLDEDSLETALSTLAGLRQEGKMIGVISHVGAMKERIGTKILVQPVREGRSVLSGPGCVGRG